MSVFNVICKNCGNFSILNYYGFCSSACCCDYAVKHGITIASAKEPFIGDHPCEAEYPGECALQETERRLGRCLERNNSLERSNEGLRKELKKSKDETRKLEGELNDLLVVIKEWREQSDRFKLMDLR